MTPADVAAWLRRHPQFLADHPALYAALSPPARVHGDVMADHMAAMLQAERSRAAKLVDSAYDAVSARRAAAGLAARVQDAVVALFSARDLIEFIASALPAHLGVDAASLCGGRFRPLPAGLVERLMAGRAVLFRSDGEARAALHGEAAPLACHDALMRLGGGDSPVLLALAARDGSVLDPRQSLGSLEFLGRALTAALEAHGMRLGGPSRSLSAVT